METKCPKPRGGTSCAVATCPNYSSKAKLSGLNISFYRLPRNITLQKQWTQKCKRVDKLNPQTSYICSAHFSENDFVRDLKSELLGYTPKFRKLNPGAVPTLNLPADHSQSNVLSKSAINRKNRNEARSKKKARDQLVSSSTTSTPFSPSPAIASTSTINEYSDLQQDASCTDNIDYKQLYNDLLKKHNEQKAQILSLKHPVVDYKEINERLQTDMNILKKQLNTANSLLKKKSKEVKIPSSSKTKTIESETENLVSLIFSPNKLNVISKQKEVVHWSRKEIAQAFILRYYSKKAYLYVKNVLQHPLPSLLYLQQWAKTIKTRNGILQDILHIMNLNGDSLQDYERLTTLMFDGVNLE